MWRINNIMLAIVLAGVIFISAFALFQSVEWRINERKVQSEHIARTLDAEGNVDAQGRKLRVQAISFDTVISDEDWGSWSLVRVEHTALRDEMPIASGGGLLGELSAPSYDRRANFANNLVLRNSERGSQRILFDKKVAIISLLLNSNIELPGVAVAYADKDTDKNGKLTAHDAIKITHFDFKQSAQNDLQFDGKFISFDQSSAEDDIFRFRAYQDLDSSGEMEANFEPVQVYEVSFLSGSVAPALSAEVIENLQSIIDSAIEETASD